MEREKEDCQVMTEALRNLKAEIKEFINKMEPLTMEMLSNLQKFRGVVERDY